MNSKRLYLVLIGVIGLLFVAMLAGVYGANSLLSSRALKLTDLKAKSMALDRERISLIKAKQDVKKYSELHTITQSVVPEDKNQAEAVREIVKIAAANNISLAAINFPASSLGNITAATTTPAPAVAPPSTAASSAASAKASALSQLLAVKNIPGVYQLIITVQGEPTHPVPYNKFISFLSDLEHNRRTAQVSTITIQPDPNNQNLLTFTLGLNEYIKP
jgi:hypothetical protein